MNYFICDGEIRYIDIGLDLPEAERLLADLLLPYPPGHAWRKRLTILPEDQCRKPGRGWAKGVKRATHVPVTSARKREQNAAAKRRAWQRLQEQKRANLGA